jgi:hypothetical protein
MSRACPQCGGTGLLQEHDNADVLATIERLRSRAAEIGVQVDWRGYVSAKDAAQVLEVSDETLAWRRRHERRPEHTGGARPRYRLDALARWLVNGE